MAAATASAVPPPLAAFFERVPRQGPGSSALAEGLLRRIRPHLPAAPLAADLGCGTGASALVLARAGLSVVAVERHRPFLDRLARDAAAAGLSSRVFPLYADLSCSGLGAGTLDLAWSEGAAYLPGFRTTLTAVADLLKPGGVFVVSECVFRQRSVPDEVRAFWRAAYPAMGTVGEAILAAEAAGYRFLEAQVLPRDAWEESFLRPVEAEAAAIEADGHADPALVAVAREQAAEVAFFRRRLDLFGYVYLVLVRPAGR